jgi:hypothetical protein
VRTLKDAKKHHLRNSGLRDKSKFIPHEHWAPQNSFELEAPKNDKIISFRISNLKANRTGGLKINTKNMKNIIATHGAAVSDWKSEDSSVILVSFQHFGRFLWIFGKPLCEMLKKIAKKKKKFEYIQEILK